MTKFKFTLETIEEVNNKIKEFQLNHGEDNITRSLDRCSSYFHLTVNVFI